MEMHNPIRPALPILGVWLHFNATLLQALCHRADAENLAVEDYIRRVLAAHCGWTP